MGGLATFIGNLLTGGLLQRGLDFLIARDREKYDALNASERLAFEDRQNARSTARDIRMATAGFWEMRLVTFVIAACFVSHLVLVTIDTNWPQPWSVPAFPKPFDEWEGLIILSFFGVQVVGTGIRSIAATSIVKARKALLTWGKPLG